MEQSIQKIKKIIQAAAINELPELLLTYESDSRSGVQNLIKSARKRIEALEKEKQRTESIKVFERQYEELGSRQSVLKKSCFRYPILQLLLFDETKAWMLSANSICSDWSRLLDLGYDIS